MPPVPNSVPTRGSTNPGIFFFWRRENRLFAVIKSSKMSFSGVFGASGEDLDMLLGAHLFF